jgi:hypothetical protein
MLVTGSAEAAISVAERLQALADARD